MHLAYLDDSGSDSPNPIAVFGGVIIEDKQFQRIETHVGALVELLIPNEKLEDFDEFHAAQLFGGFGIFHGIDQELRYETISHLLRIVAQYQLPYVYAAVDKAALLSSPFRSSAPVDVAFNMCALGVDQWLRGVPPPAVPHTPYGGSEALCVMVVDDTDDKNLKQMLKRSFRSLRKRMHVPVAKMSENRLWYVHDDMYFGDSKDSVGIQIADVCNYFMMRKLRGEDDGEFYEAIKPSAICAQVEPEYSQCAHFLKQHDPVTLTSLRAKAGL